MSDVTITQGTVSHALSATTPNDPTAEIRPEHWNSAHAASLIIAASALLPIFSNANGISFGTSNDAITASYTVPAVPGQSVQTQPAGNIAGAGFTSTTTAGVDVKATQNSAGLSMAVPAYLTTQSVQTQASGNIPRSGFTTTTVAGDKIAGTNNTDGLLVAVPAYLTTAALSQDSSKYAGTGFTSTTTAGTEIEATLGTNGLSMAVPAYLTNAVGGGNFSAGVSGGNTAGDTGATGTRVVFAGGNNITLSQATNANGATITVSGPNTAAQSAQSAIEGLGVSNVGNTAGNTGVVTGVDFVLAGSGEITLSQQTGAAARTIHFQHPAWLTTAAQSNHSHGNPQLNLTNLSGTTASNSAGFTLSLSAAAPGGGAAFTHSAYNPIDGAVLLATSNGNGTIMVYPCIFPNVQFDRFGIVASISKATNSTGSLTLTLRVGLYTKNASTLSLAHSSSTTLGLTLSGTANSTVYSGPRNFTLGWTTTIPQGDYWVAIQTASVTGGNQATAQYLVVSASNTNFSGMLGAGSATSAQLRLGFGSYSASSAALPDSMAFSHIQGTNPAAMRPPYFWMRSDTA